MPVTIPMSGRQASEHKEISHLFHNYLMAVPPENCPLSQPQSPATFLHLGSVILNETWNIQA